MLRPKPLACLLIAAGLLSGCGDEAIRKEADGSYSGAGVVEYFYDDDVSVMRADSYADGRIVESAWYDRGGVLLFKTEWTEDGRGTEYYLHQDGSLRMMVPMKNDVAEGPAEVRSPDGDLLRRPLFKEGIEIEKGTIPRSGINAL